MKGDGVVGTDGRGGLIEGGEGGGDWRRKGARPRRSLSSHCSSCLGSSSYPKSVSSFLFCCCASLLFCCHCRRWVSVHVRFMVFIFVWVVVGCRWHWSLCCCWCGAGAHSMGDVVVEYMMTTMNDD